MECLYEMFRDRVEENVVYIVYSENDSKIDSTIDQLMSIAACSFTGYHFELGKTTPEASKTQKTNAASQSSPTCGAASATTRSQTKAKRLADNEKQRLALVNNNNPKSAINPADKTSQASEVQVKLDEDNEALSIDERIEILQNSIDSLQMEKSTSHEKASKYLSRKMYPVTSYYSELASQYRRMIETKTKKLVDLLLLKHQDSSSIDLHGLNPIQARLVVNEFLNIRQDKLSIDKQPEVSIDIITGWGKHTETNNQHRIRPTILALLREKGFQYYHLNRGALRVTIRR